MRTGIILAGGKSSRMGQNKALLPFREKTVIEHIVNELSHITDRLLIVTNTPTVYEFLGQEMTEDVWKEKGPLAGIHAGLSASRTEENLLVACDMPFISKELAAYLFHRLEDRDAVIPHLDGQLHPLFAVYRKSITNKVEEALTQNQLRIRALLDQIKTKVVTEEELYHHHVSFQALDVFNMNHPHEYEQAIHFSSKGSEES